MSGTNVFQVALPEGGGAVQLRKRSAVMVGFIWLLGTIPALLHWLFGLDISPALEVFGWGLWFPGGGFIAIGGWSILWTLLVIGLFMVSFLLWSFTGMLVAPLLVWLGAAIVASLTAPATISWQANVIIPLVGCALILWRNYEGRKMLRKTTEVGKARALRMPTLVEELSKKAEQAPDPQEMELEQLEALRYLIDLTRQSVGSLEGFTRIDNFQAASLRYQLSYLSYGLSMAQVRYTPNFHGYLNEAQQFAIESLTNRKVCGYWKWENLWGNFRWNPNPIDLDNVMLTGWAQVGLAAYTATTGDQRYQAKGALPFKPTRNEERIYHHDTHSFNQSIIDNWNRAPTLLYACEPHWVFPVCNIAAFSGVGAYDRANGTKYAEQYKKRFIKQLKADFLLPDGNLLPVLNSLTGWTWLTSGFPRQVAAVFLLQLSRMSTNLDMDLSRQWYLIARDEYLKIDTDGRLQLIGFEWSSLLDGGHYRKGPAEFLGNIAIAAKEHGDTEMAKAALKEVDERLVLAEKPGVRYYDDVSTPSNIFLATARFIQRYDWRKITIDGPDPATFEGPLLTKCSYPEVLVAAAHGDANGLKLVLYPGIEPGEQTIQIERLQSNSVYRVEGAADTTIILGNKETIAILQVQLEGRTEINIIKEN